jgi:GMP synthase (glutamine-hydrolysing)
MFDRIKFLLIQIRNPDDPIRKQEVGCFARALKCDPAQIEPNCLLQSAPMQRELDRVDMVLIGGSGHYSATSNGEWLKRGLDSMRLLHDSSKPTFASCWGFQAMARAMGGEVIHDLERSELGTHRLRLTAAGQQDPIFGALPVSFDAQMGHEDRVSRLPPGTTLLASTDLVANQAYRFDNKPIYCTQFHPELDRATILERLRAYPEYVERIERMTLEEFGARCHDTPETESLLLRMVRYVFGNGDR